MDTQKLIVTHRGNLVAKYGERAADIDQAVAKLIAADAGRGIRTHYVRLDDVEEMKKYHSKTVSKKPTASSCKKVIDNICSFVVPDYIVLLGSDDVIPHFRVANPTYAAEGDTDEEVPTDNPYAASPAFNAKSRDTYLVSDRVVGRIPDVPGANNPAALLNYLAGAASAHPLNLAEFATDLLVCCDAWKKSGAACVAEIARAEANLFLSPPTDAESGTFQSRHAARLQMIKCHGAPLDPHFYGQQGENFPPVLFSGSLKGRTAPGTVVGAMCCYGAAVYDPSHPAALIPGVPALANVYLDHAAAGFAGSTGIAWVGVNEIACADLIICRFLENVMAGMSLGAALLDSKQRFLADIQKDGRMPDAAEEKTLLQFLLLGDSSLRAVTSREEQEAATSIVHKDGLHFVHGDKATSFDESGKQVMMPIIASVAAASERRSRRAYHFRTARNLRETLPEREVTEPPFTAAQILNADELAYLGARKPVVHRLTRTTVQPQVRTRKAFARAVTAAASAVGVETEHTISTTLHEETLQYYWFARTPRERVIDATIVKVETDLHGNVLRKCSLVTA